MRAVSKALPENAHDYMHELGRAARGVARAQPHRDGAARDRALLAIAECIEARKRAILDANRRDLEAASGGAVPAALLERLQLTAPRVAAMAEGMRRIAALPDPVGEIIGMTRRPSGLRVGRMRVPLGVVGIIYESRPNVTADASALCLKAGNAAILRGGSEALRSNLAIAAAISEGLSGGGLPGACVQVVNTPDREAVTAMLAMKDCIDVIVPRGGKGLVDRVSEESQVPVIAHREGICHVYIDAGAAPQQAMDIAFNAKTYRYGICGAMETLLVHEEIAPRVLPPLAARFAGHGVELRGCEQSRALHAAFTAATEEDWRTEYLGPVLSVRVVAGLGQAIEHIARYGSGHTDAIVTTNLERAQHFVNVVDSSSVMVNAPTCFADGGEYGLGAEIGISTNKLHVRGPVGLEGLTTLKYVVYGDGQLRHCG